MQKNFKTIVFVLFILVNFVANAQRFNAGISAAFVGSDVYGADIVPDEDEWNDTDFRKLGFMLGGAVTSNIGKRAKLRLELNYIQKGTQQRPDSLGNGYYKFSFNYIEVPLMIKYRLRFNVAKKPVDGFDLHAGVSAGQLIGSKAEGANFYSKNDFTYFNRTDVSLLAGFGYNFSKHFNFSVRYSNSLIPVFKRVGSPLYFGQSFNNGNNMVLHFMLQYMFGAEKKELTPVDENNNQ